MRRGPRRNRMPEPAANELRVNKRIRVPRVLLIDEHGTKLGEFMTQDALAMAVERGLDLIEVAPNGRPPVCKIGDHGRMKYEKKKRENVARKNQVQVQTKEVKLRPKTDEHDIAVKISNARRFLEAGDKVKVTVRFRGREMAHRDIGVQQCLRVAEALADVGSIEAQPRMDGRQMFMLLAPIKRAASRTSTESPEESSLTRAKRRSLEASARAKGGSGDSPSGDSPSGDSPSGDSPPGDKAADSDSS